MTCPAWAHSQPVRYAMLVRSLCPTEWSSIIVYSCIALTDEHTQTPPSKVEAAKCVVACYQDVQGSQETNCTCDPHTSESAKCTVHRPTASCVMDQRQKYSHTKHKQSMRWLQCSRTETTCGYISPKDSNVGYYTATKQGEYFHLSMPSVSTSA